MFFWKLAERERLPLPRITIVNLYPPSEVENELLKSYNINWIVADGKNLPFRNLSFDIVFCNSVIEHLGKWDDQRKFAGEVMRVGIRYFVQTPNRNFFIEPHLLTPFIHWLPYNIQRSLIRNFTIWGLLTRPDKDKVSAFLSEVRLLTDNEMKLLFPEAKIIYERFLLMNKSIIAVKL